MIRLSILAGLVLVALDAVIGSGLGLLFAIGFPLVCLAGALAVRPRDFFQVGVLPPLLMLGLMGLTAALHRPTIAASGDGWLQALIVGMADHAVPLAMGYGLALACLGVRQRVLSRHLRPSRPRRAKAQAKRSGSPAPTRTTSGAPAEKSTTVVGKDPHSPESSTASSW